MIRERVLFDVLKDGTLERSLNAWWQWSGALFVAFALVAVWRARRNPGSAQAQRLQAAMEKARFGTWMWRHPTTNMVLLAGLLCLFLFPPVMGAITYRRDSMRLASHNYATRVGPMWSDTVEKLGTRHLPFETDRLVVGGLPFEVSCRRSATPPKIGQPGACFSIAPGDMLRIAFVELPGQRYELEPLRIWLESDISRQEDH